MSDKKTNGSEKLLDKHLYEKLAAKFFEMNENESNRISVKISVIYLIVGAMWILLSDKIAGFLVTDKDSMTFISMIKGWVYVAITGILIFVLVQSALKKIKNTEIELRKSNQDLISANEGMTAAFEQLAASEEMLRLQYEESVKNHQQLKEYEKKLHSLAYHDQLTGLYNRLTLKEKLIEVTEAGQVRRNALLFVDIDNFKYVNDTMGHTFGDLLLVQVSQRLIQMQEVNSSVYRLGGDEFIILIEDFEDISEVEKMAVKVLKGLKNRIEIGSSSLFTTISIGISIFPEHGNSMDELLKNADIAVYKAKEAGRNKIVFYDEPMNEAVIERMLIEKQLRTALENNEFELHYQPQLDIESGKISGFEALIRWKNSELGFVSPAKFIHIAEDTHLIIPIGEWVLRNASLFLKRLIQRGYEDLTISINVSMLQLLQDDFVDIVIDTLEVTKLDPQYLEIEITESILMESYDAIAGKLKLLRAKGIKLALDDFGKGYSSLNYLRQLPISTLKIDKTFIDTISTEGKGKSLTDLIVRIGRSMDLCVVAEGVETQEQMDYLIKHRCNKIQGYLFCKPLSENEALIKVLGGENQ